MPKPTNVATFLQLVPHRSKAVADYFLQKNGNRLGAAIDDYYNNEAIADKLEIKNLASAKKSAKAKPNAVLVEIFNKYKEPEPDAVGNQFIGIDGTIQYLEDLGYDPEDVVVLTLAEFLESPTAGVFKEEPFLKKWTSVNCSSIAQMKDYIKQLELKLETDAQYFKKIYQFTFKFNLEAGDKKLAYETAVEYWKLLIPSEYSEQLQKFIKFIETEWKKEISGDQWNMLLPFFEETKSDPTFANFDESQSWPVLFDVYVEWSLEQN